MQEWEALQMCLVASSGSVKQVQAWLETFPDTLNEFVRTISSIPCTYFLSEGTNVPQVVCLLSIFSSSAECHRLFVLRKFSHGPSGGMFLHLAPSVQGLTLLMQDVRFPRLPNFLSICCWTEIGHIECMSAYFSPIPSGCRVNSIGRLIWRACPSACTSSCTSIVVGVDVNYSRGYVAKWFWYLYSCIDLDLARW